MIRINLSLVFALFLPILVNAQGIEFIHGDWDKAVQQAKEEDKIIFVDAYAQWCGPCKRMSRNIFPKERVGEYFNSHFINVKMDMEHGEGPQFGKKYPVRGFPTLMFIQPDGKLLHQVVGARDANGLLQVGAKAFSMFDKNSEYRQAYEEEGKRDFETVYGYILSCKKNDEPTIKIANEYLDSDPQLTEKQRLKITFAAAREADSKLYEEALKEKSTIIDMVGKVKYEEEMVNAVMNTIKKAVKFQYEPLKDDAIATLKKVNKDGFNFNKARAEMLYYSLMEDENQFLKAAERLHQLSDKKALSEQLSIAKDITTAFQTSRAEKRAALYVEKAFNNSDDIKELLDAAQFCVMCEAFKTAEKILSTAKAIDKSIVNNQQYKALKEEVDSVRG